MNKIKTKLIIFIILLPVICFFAIWGIAMIKCNVLTLLHGNEFKEVYKETTMIGDIDYLRVLDYSDTYANVYYVSENKTGGDVLQFINRNNVWECSSWKTVWSGTGGSASEVIWPYWWHFIYGGF